MSKHGRTLSAICGIALLGLATPRETLAGPFDGTYTGKQVLTKGSQSCRTEDPVSVTIKGAIFTITNSALKNFKMRFHPRADGSFDQMAQRSGVLIVGGRIVGNTMDADVSTDACKYHWHLEKP